MIGLRIFYFILLIGSVAFYILYLDNLSLYLLLFILLMPLAVFVILMFSVRKLSFSLKTTQSIYSKGGAFPLLLEVENTGKLPISSAVITIECSNVLTGSKQQVKITTPIFPNNTQTLRLEITPEHCGILKLSIYRVRIYDYLHVFKRTIRKKKLNMKFASCEVLVSPEIQNLNIDLGTNSLPDYESDTFSKTKSGDDPSEIFDMHEYKPGDKINRIHWKLTAKQDQMYVKEYSLPINNSICLIFDSRLNAESYSNETAEIFDTCMELMFSVSAFLSDYNIPHRIIYLSSETSMLENYVIEDPDELPVAVEAILKNGYSDFSGSSPIEEFLADNVNARQYRIIYFSHKLTDSEINDISTYNDMGNVTAMLASHNVSPEARSYGNIEVISVVPGKISESVEFIKI